MGHRRELYVHCYRMLGSLSDAKDALQETLLAAWRGLAGFEQRSSLRAWLYRIATNCCIRLASRRPRRILSWDHGPSWDPAGGDLGTPVEERIFLDPLPHTGMDRDAPASSYGRREHVALAYVAALQHLTANQRAVLIRRDVLSFTAAETADMLDTSVPSVASALQRARSTIADRAPDAGERLDSLTIGKRRAVDRWVAAWERADVLSIVELLAEDVRFTMPPLPAWFDGRGDVVRFIGDRVFATPWRLLPMTANGQPAIACYQGVDGRVPPERPQRAACPRRPHRLDRGVPRPAGAAPRRPARRSRPILRAPMSSEVPLSLNG